MSNHAAIIRAANAGKPVLRRGKHFIEFDNGDNTKRWVSTIEPLHYGIAEDQEIDTGWIADTGAWQWQNILNSHLIHARDVFNVGNLFEWRIGDEWVIIDPQSINWINQDTSRQQIAIKQAASGAVDDDLMTFTDAYGSGIHYELFAHPKRLIKHITIDSFSDLAPVEPWLTGTIWFEAEFTISTSAGVEMYLDDVLWEKTNGVRVQTSNRIEFRETATGIVVWYADAPSATDANGDTISAQYEVRNQSGTYFITVRVPYGWMETAVYPVKIDPTFTDGYGGDVSTYIDAFFESGQPDTNWDETYLLYNVFNSHKVLYFFDVSSLSGYTVNSATLSLYFLTDPQTWTANYINFYSILSANDGWLETCTWNYADGAGASQRWAGDTGNDGGADAGCSVSGTDYNATPIFTSPDLVTYVADDELACTLVTSQVQDWVDGDNYGIVSFIDAVFVDFYSSDHATTGYRPLLTIDYDAGGDFPFSDNFTGTPGDPWAAANWTTSVG
jgi:hypothetical protein